MFFVLILLLIKLALPFPDYSQGSITGGATTTLSFESNHELSAPWLSPGKASFIGSLQLFNQYPVSLFLNEKPFFQLDIHGD
jgi:hypothetical protein